MPTISPTETKLSIADTIWLATALLHQEHPDAAGFDHQTILRKVIELDSSLNPRSISTHLSTHCVASKKANPATLRILTENQDGTLRLYRPGDPCHPSRRAGRSVPKHRSFPDAYKDLLQTHYTERRSVPGADSPQGDPILAMSGIGKEMWKKLGGGEAFIRALREEVFPAHMVPSGSAPDFNEIWARIKRECGKEFRTVRGEPFSYNIRGNIVVPRPQKGKPTARQLPRSDFEEAWALRPLSGPGQIKHLQGSSYVYGILTDPRISTA